MQFNEYQIKAGETAIYPGRNSNLLYPMLGLAGEIGELIGKYLSIMVNFTMENDESEWLIYDTLSTALDALSKCEQLKKTIRDGDTEVSQSFVFLAKSIQRNIDETSHDAMTKELGDILWYLSQTAYELGIKLDNVAQWNINKLQSRKTRDVIHGSGDDR